MENIIIGKSRRLGFSNNHSLWEEFNYIKDPNYNIRQQCKGLYKEFLSYNMVNYKEALTQEENKNINNMLESNDKYVLELCKQILLVKLNN